MKKIISTILTFAMLLSMITIVQAADFSGGGYNFVCADGGRYLNVYAGKDADGTNVCVWEKDGSPEQNYTISACGGGKYKLYPASSSSRVIDVNRGNSYSNPLKAGLNVDLWRTNDAPAQEFYITHVGNNLYKIELAALSGHVLQANNPNKNNGNVTLERYTGAANQHWKILKNGTQVVEPCIHKNVSNRNEKTEIKQKDDSTHTVITTYNRVCNDCDAVVGKNVSTSKTVNHQINNGICSECGYKEPVKEVVQETTKVPEKETEEKCTHSRTYDGDVKSTEVSVKNDEYHTVEETYDVYCCDCDAAIKTNTKRAYSEKHTLNNDACTLCSYAVEKEVCKHVNTAKHHVDNSDTYAKKNDSVHSITKSYDVFCVDCQTYIQKGLSETSDEAHSISNYKCGACGYEQPTHSKTVADGLYNIKNVSSGYMMNVYAGKDANGTKVTMWENDNSTDQKIYIAHQGDGKYLLKFNASSGGRVIDVNRGNSITASIDDGDKIDIWTANDLDAQLFYINDCGNGKYTFELVSKPGYVISPVNASAAKQNGSQLELKKDVNADYQRWNVVKPSSASQSLTSARTTAPATNNSYYYSNGNIYYACNYAPKPGNNIKGNCTWYAWGRAWEITGKKLPTGFNSNAYTWWNGSIGKFSRGSEPRVGAIAVWKSSLPGSGGCGHVAIVEKIENGKVYISESGYPNTLFKYRQIYSTSYLYGYIYIN